MRGAGYVLVVAVAAAAGGCGSRREARVEPVVGGELPARGPGTGVAPEGDAAVNDVVATATVTLKPAALGPLAAIAQARFVLGGAAPRLARNVVMVAFSPDGQRLATVDGDGRVVVFDVASGRAVGEAPKGGYNFFVAYAGGELVNDVDTNALLTRADDGRWLAIDGEHGRVLLDPRSGRGFELTGPAPSGFSVGGDTVALLAEDRTVTAGKLGGPLAVIATAAEATYLVSVSPDGSQLATVRDDRTLRLQPTAGGRARDLRLDALAEDGEAVFALAWSPDGTRLALVIDRRRLVVVDVARGTGREVARDAFGNDITFLAYSPDGRRLAGGTKYGPVRHWDAATGALVHAHDGHIGTAWGVAVTDDGATVASAGDERALVWTPGTSTASTPFADHEHWVTDVALSPDGRLLASCSDYGDVNVRSLPSGKLVARLEIDGSECEGLALRQDRLYAATGRQAQIFPLRTGAAPRVIALAAGRKYGSSVFAASHDGALVAAGGDDGKIAVHAAPGGALRWAVELPPHSYEEGERVEAEGLAFDPTGKLLAAVGEDSLVRVYDARTGRTVRTHRLPGDARPTSIAWVGARLAIGRVDGQVLVLDARGKPVLDARHNNGGVFALAASATRLVAGGEDGAVLVWDL